ncbi:MAG TPA: ABC transporter substrate-binding protein, partial [Stellaceae bacterium]|nr:ABC transporter substrate-binding protein [Stellaceae bacterium]
MKRGFGWLALTALALASTPVFAEDTIKIAYIDPLSGPFANAGDLGLKHFQFLAEKINAAGGVNGQRIEFIPFDDEVNPEKALIVLKKAMDDGIRYVTQGNGSSVAYAISDAV